MGEKDRWFVFQEEKSRQLERGSSKDVYHVNCAGVMLSLDGDSTQAL